MTTPFMKAHRRAESARESANFVCRRTDVERCSDVECGFCPRTLERNIKALHEAEKLQGKEYYLRDCWCKSGTETWHRKKEYFIKKRDARIARFVREQASPEMYPKFIDEAFRHLDDSTLARAYISVYPHGYLSRGYIIDLCAIVVAATREFWYAQG